MSWTWWESDKEYHMWWNGHCCMATRILCPYHPNKLPCHRMKVTIHFKSYFDEILIFLLRVTLRNDSTTKVVFMRDSMPFFYMNTKCKYRPQSKFTLIIHNGWVVENPIVRWGHRSPNDLERWMLTMSFLLKLSCETNATCISFS